MANFDLQILKQLKSLFPVEPKPQNQQPTVEINADTLFETAFFLTINSAQSGNNIDITESGAIDNDEPETPDVTEDSDFATQFKENLLELIQSLVGKDKVPETDKDDDVNDVGNETQKPSGDEDTALVEKLENFQNAINALLDILLEKFGNKDDANNDKPVDDEVNTDKPQGNNGNSNVSGDTIDKFKDALMQLLDKIMGNQKPGETKPTDDDKETNADGSSLKTEDLVGADLEEFEKIASKSPAFQALIEACGADKVFDMLDTDGDGKLSDAELASVAGLDGDAKDISMDDFLMNLITKMMGLDDVLGEEDDAIDDSMPGVSGGTSGGGAPSGVEEPDDTEEDSMPSGVGGAGSAG